MRHTNNVLIKENTRDRIMIQRIMCICIILLMTGCYERPSAKITNEYVHIVKPGQICGLVELKNVITDSILGYPIKEEAVIAYSIVKRSSKKKIDGNGEVKMYFNKQHKKYIWKVWDGQFLSDFRYADTIKLKSNTWYRLSTERYRYEVYYFWDEIKREYITKVKPDPGAF